MITHHEMELPVYCQHSTQHLLCILVKGSVADSAPYHQMGENLVVKMGEYFWH